MDPEPELLGGVLIPAIEVARGSGRDILSVHGVSPWMSQPQAAGDVHVEFSTRGTVTFVRGLQLEFQGQVALQAGDPREKALAALGDPHWTASGVDVYEGQQQLGDPGRMYLLIEYVDGKVTQVCLGVEPPPPPDGDDPGSGVPKVAPPLPRSGQEVREP